MQHKTSAGYGAEDGCGEEKVPLGYVSAVHGLKGWVKVFSRTDPVERILEYSPWILRGSGSRETKIEKGRRQGKGILVQLEGVDNRNQAEELIGTEILVDRKQLPDLEEGEYYWHDLKGLEVVNTDGEIFGRVDHMMETGANDVMVVEPFEGSMDDESRLIPYLEDKVVMQVDLDSTKIVVDWQADY